MAYKCSMLKKQESLQEDSRNRLRALADKQAKDQSSRAEYVAQLKKKMKDYLTWILETFDDDLQLLHSLGVPRTMAGMVYEPAPHNKLEISFFLDHRYLPRFVLWSGYDDFTMVSGVNVWGLDHVTDPVRFAPFVENFDKDEFTAEFEKYLDMVADKLESQK